MREFKVGPEVYATLSPSRRFGALRWWFILFLLVGLIAAGWVVWVTWHEVFAPPAKPPTATAIMSRFLPIAFADTVPSNGGGQPPKTGQSPSKQDTSPLKMYLMVGIIAVIAFVLVLSLIVSFFSKDEKAVERASDLVKTCLGFFIGAATGYFGSGGP